MYLVILQIFIGLFPRLVLITDFMNKMADTLSLCTLLHQCMSTSRELFDRFLQDIIQQNHAGGRPWSNGSGDS